MTTHAKDMKAVFHRREPTSVSMETGKFRVWRTAQSKSCQPRLDDGVPQVSQQQRSVL